MTQAAARPKFAATSKEQVPGAAAAAVRNGAGLEELAVSDDAPSGGEARNGGDGEGPRTERIVERIAVGIVLERRKSKHRWLDYAWKPVAAIAGAPPRDPRGEWALAAAGEEWTHFHAGTLTLELFRKETEGYRVNLSQEPPRLFVVLRDLEDPEVEHPLVPVFVTACPYEAQDYLDSANDLVEPVAMPPELIGFLQAFVDRHHVDQPFKKRKRRPHDPRKVGFAGSGGPAPVDRPRRPKTGEDA